MNNVTSYWNCCLILSVSQIVKQGLTKWRESDKRLNRASRSDEFFPSGVYRWSCFSCRHWIMAVQSISESWAVFVWSLGPSKGWHLLWWSSLGFSSCSSLISVISSFFTFPSCALSSCLGDRKNYFMSPHPSLSIFHADRGLVSLRVQY